MTEKREKIMELTNSLLDAEKAFTELVFGVVPEDARKHINNARREQLLALRSLLDARIATLEEEKEGEAKEVNIEE